MRQCAAVLMMSLLVAACTSTGPSKGTRLQSSWADSGASLISGKRVLVVFRDKDTELRREVETEMANLVPGALLGVDVLSTPAMLTESAATRAALQSQAIDYVLVMHFDGFTPAESYSAATLYRQQVDTGFYSYWDNGWKAAYKAESVKTDKRLIAQADTRVYDIVNGKLVWSAKSESFNPQDRASAVRQILKVNADGMRKAGLLEK